MQSIVAVLIAFISAMAFANATLSWFCGLLGYENMTLDVSVVVLETSTIYSYWVILCLIKIIYSVL